MDWRCNAARAAISSRTSVGTSLMVICTDMTALCHQRQRLACSLRRGRVLSAPWLRRCCGDGEVHFGLRKSGPLDMTEPLGVNE